MALLLVFLCAALFGSQAVTVYSLDSNLNKTNYVLTDEASQRRDKVRAAMLHAWTSYERYAWGSDELKPLSKTGVDDFGGFGLTILDSLDTLYIMGFRDQFTKARNWVAKLDFNKNHVVSTFETTIRLVGGLISAYDLSNDTMFLKKAKELADRLLPAWNTRTGIPHPQVNLATGATGNDELALAELGSEQVEFIALSQRTGDAKYQNKVEKVISKMKTIFPKDGLLRDRVRSQTLQNFGKVTLGGGSDSFYEYLLKVWVLGGKTEAVRSYREMWERSMEGLRSLLRKTTPSSYVYISERNSGRTDPTMDELACFTPGMLVLGSYDGPEAQRSKYLWLAEELARTCYSLYRSSATGLAGETYESVKGQDMVIQTASNILRPETVESLMYLWRRTGDRKYQDWGWEIFQAFEQHSRVKTGYVGLVDVRTGEQDDKMQSFFLAETLKYLYLLFSPPTVLPLDKWVFNTEAHPIRIVPRE